MSNDRMKRFEELIQFARTMGLSRLADTWQSCEASLLQNQVRVVILGEFNHGKSSLLNALIGEAVLPFGVTPTTQLDTWIAFGCEKKRVSAFSGGECVQVWDWDEWMRLSNRCMPEILKDKLVDRLSIELDSDKFDNSCIFIDTPGLNEAFLARESYLQRYLNRADLLVFVLDANQALTHMEQTVIREFSSVLASEQCILVINKCDRLDDEEWLEVCHYVEQSLAPVTGDERFYMVSARKQKVGDWQEMLQRIRDGILTRKLGHEFDAMDRQNAEMALILEGFLMIWKALEKLPAESLENLKKGSVKTLNAAELAGVLQGISTEMNRLNRQTGCDIGRFKTDFLKAMPRELDKSSINSIEKYFEDFIDENYVQFADSIKNRLKENISDVVMRALKELMPDEFPQLVYDIELEEVDKVGRNVVSTGAFDLSNSLGIWKLPLPSLITARAERSRREALKSMSEKAISIRAEQYSLAFGNSLSHLHNVITALFRENGLQLNNYVVGMADCLINGAEIDESVL